MKEREEKKKMSEEEKSGAPQYTAGSRVKILGKGRKMDGKAMDTEHLKIGDNILAIDPESGMKRIGEDQIYFTVYKAPITKVTRYTGIRTGETAHNYLRDDGLWSNDRQEEDQ